MGTSSQTLHPGPASRISVRLFSDTPTDRSGLGVWTHSYNGVDFIQGLFPNNLTEAEYLNHDRISRARLLDLGSGGAFMLNRSTNLFFGLLRDQQSLAILSRHVWICEGCTVRSAERQTTAAALPEARTALDCTCSKSVSPQLMRLYSVGSCRGKIRSRLNEFQLHAGKRRTGNQLEIACKRWRAGCRAPNEIPHYAIALRTFSKNVVTIVSGSPRPNASIGRKPRKPTLSITARRRCRSMGVDFPSK